MKDYELVVLLHPDLEIDLDKPLKKVESIIKQYGGKTIKTDVWGKRKLAYAINHEEFAVYVYFDVQVPPEAIGKLEKAFNITDEVLRYLLTYPVPESEDKPESNDNNEEDQSAEPGEEE